jgi:hypothetical protein
MKTQLARLLLVFCVACLLCARGSFHATVPGARSPEPMIMNGGAAKDSTAARVDHRDFRADPPAGDLRSNRPGGGGGSGGSGGGGSTRYVLRNHVAESFER